MNNIVKLALSLPALVIAGCAHTPAPDSAAAPPPAAPAAATSTAAAPAAPLFLPGGPDQLVVSFAHGGATLSHEAQAQLDKAARTYRDGHPIMMYVAGFTDRQGSELPNLMLAARRAEVVKEGLVARGIPAERLQAAALGEADPVVQTAEGVPEPANRRVVITWK